MSEEGALQHTASSLNRAVDGSSPLEIVSKAVQSVTQGRLAVVSAFGIESAVLLKLVADVDRTTPVIFLDTGWLFKETLAYRDALSSRLGLTDVRAFTPSANQLAKQDPKRDLWLADPDACCHVRKVVPLADALRPFDAWLNGRKRYQGAERSRLPVVECDGRRLKFNPLAHVSREEVERMFDAANLPRHPLQAAGFSSVGCVPCTSRTLANEDPRAGRWRGRGKTECGIHASLDAQERGNPPKETDRRPVVACPAP